MSTEPHPPAGEARHTPGRHLVNERVDPASFARVAGALEQIAEEIARIRAAMEDEGQKEERE